MQSIFSGLRVIDCATYIAGPAAATILSDFGAEVIKIERPPYGDPYRYLAQMAGMPANRLNYNWILDSRNKKSAALDLNDSEARAALLKLIETADVFITNFQPVLLRKFRLEYEDLQPLNPRLVYASVSGYGEHGDDADSPGYDITAYWARSGLMHSIHNADAEPALPPTGLGDHPTSITLFASILMALYQRQITGVGARARTSLVANGVWSNACIIQGALCGAEFPGRPTRKSAINPLVNHYVAADDRRLFLCLLDPVSDWPKLCTALGWQDRLEDQRFRNAPARANNNVELIALLDEALATQDLDHWRRVFREHGLVWGPVPSVLDVAQDPGLDANGVFAELEPGLKTVQNPINVDGIGKLAPGHAPAIGEHTREVLRAAGCDDSQISRMIQKGAAYAGDPPSGAAGPSS
jgi:crotonobetainyl-CoA:carnitine CoA-transferase CaiB-like acyl-CoA transferase